MYFGNLKRLKNQYNPKSFNVPVHNYKGFRNRCTMFKDGFYDADILGKFRAGSYTGYGAWRNLLCEMANEMSEGELWARADPSLHFYELIDFADDKGTLDYKVCERLLKDFDAFDQKAKSLDNEDLDWFYEAYKLWHEAVRKVVEAKGVLSFV